MHELEVKKFRCFKSRKFTFNKQFTLVTGDNGSGKTSLAEAIHYLCYMKSFRCSTMSNLICYDHDSFFLKGSFTLQQLFNEGETAHTIQVGYTQKKKAIKLDNKSISTHKELFKHFQVITLLEEDIDLIRGYPTIRRSFMDQSTLFLDPSYVDIYRKFKRVVQSRNALLHKFSIDRLELEIWSEKLWNASIQVQNHRISVLKRVQEVVNELLTTYFNGVYKVKMEYVSKSLIISDTFDHFNQKSASLFQQEIIMKRSLFGAHLDDFSIFVTDKSARSFASRGQQKLVSLLCKLSLMTLAKENDFLPVVIVDDFIADFDKARLSGLIDLFSKCKNQIIITTPLYDSELKRMIEKVEPDVLSMQ